MPIYTYFRDSTQEFIDIVQGMNDQHRYSGQCGEQDDWRRVFYSPQMSVDTQIDPFSSKQFNDRTRDKKGTFGHMLDYSSEMSDKRASQAGGVDPVKQKYFENYSKTRKGAKHTAEMKKVIENKNVKIDFTKD
jgi:hypothetical protein